MKRFAVPALLTLLLLLHLPFLGADPDTQADLHTRGAWTDEGLYSSQVRNLVDEGTFNMKENSTFVRGPLFGILQAPFFYLFGTQLGVARLITVMTLILALYQLLKRKEDSLLGPALLVTTFLQFHLFLFSHYAMAELMAIAFILISLYFMREQRQLPAALFLFFAYSLKIQFLYAAAIPPMTIFITGMLYAMRGDASPKSFVKPFLVSLASALGLALVYGLWYLANKDFYNYIMGSETTGRYPAEWSYYLPTLKFNFSHYLWTPQLKILVLTGLGSLVALPWFLISRRSSEKTVLVYAFALSWLLLELHKIPMLYIPNRYLLPLFAALGLLFSLGLAELAVRKGLLRSLAWCVLIAAGLLNFSFLTEAYQRRTYDLEALNTYLGRHDLRGSTLLGAWTPSLSWESGGKALPVWNNYFNSEKPIERFRPRLVVKEFNEADSDKAYESQGINLAAISDSVRKFKVWRYDLEVYWLSDRQPPVVP